MENKKYEQYSILNGRPDKRKEYEIKEKYLKVLNKLKDGEFYAIKISQITFTNHLILEEVCTSIYEIINENNELKLVDIVGGILEIIFVFTKTKN